MSNESREMISPDRSDASVRAIPNFAVSHAQLAVFSSSLEQPFNDWTEQHVSQGFSWRPGSVSFRCLVESGNHVAEVVVADRVGKVDAAAVRVIEVPFEAPADGSVEVGSIFETALLAVPPGSYLLRCEFLGSGTGDHERLRLTFSRDDVPHFAVVLADAALNVKGDLLKTAKPAM